MWRRPFDVSSLTTFSLHIFTSGKCPYFIASCWTHVELRQVWQRINLIHPKGTSRVPPMWPQSKPKVSFILLLKWPQSTPQGDLRLPKSDPQRHLRVLPKIPKNTSEVSPERLQSDPQSKPEGNLRLPQKLQITNISLWQVEEISQKNSHTQIIQF